MRKPILPVALLAIFASLAVVQLRRSPSGLSTGELRAVLERPLDLHGRKLSGPVPPFWKALLESPAASHDGQGTTLRLGRVQADPSSARGSALGAGELLALEAEDAQGSLGKPLWRALIDGRYVRETPAGRVLELYGCRHSADADAAPLLEDNYHARQSIAHALEDLIASAPELGPIQVLGQDAPIRGGANFEVQLLGQTQSLIVTLDGHPEATLQVSRPQRHEAPNDEAARAHLVAALHALARANDAGPLTIEGEDTPAEGGVDVRIELNGGRLSIRALHAGAHRLSAHLQFGQDE